MKGKPGVQPWRAGTTWQLDDPPPVGPRRLTAYALALLNLDVVSRATLRAMLPAGTNRRAGAVKRASRNRKGSGGSSINRTSAEFGTALQLFEVSGWIRRGEAYVLVLDHNALFDYALHELDHLPTQLLELHPALAAVQHQVATEALTPKALEQAHREVGALRRLMAPEVRGANWSGRGSVRRVGPAGSGGRR